MSARTTFAMAAAVLAAGCSDGRSHARATCVLVDVSGTYDDQRPEVAHIVRTGLLPKVRPGDTFLLVRIDGESYGKENVEATVTLDSQPSRANAQKLALAAKLDRFAAARKRARFTDISGALMLAAEYLRETRAGKKTIVIFSDMKEELPPGAKRALGPKELEGIDVVALNVKRLAADKLDPAAYRKRLGTWATRLSESGAASWKVVLDPEELVKELAEEM
jgi:hypothetical protein